MSCWDVLGIEYTKDIKSIKKAYAEKLRQINPDEELKKFQQLKEAFDQALRIATNQGVFFPDEPEILEDLQEGSQSGQHNSALSKNKLFTEVEEFLDGLEFFDDVAGWREIFSENTTWSINEFMEYSYMVQEMLVDKGAYFAKPVIELFFELFQLDELESEVNGSEFISEDFLQMRSAIEQRPDFNFSFWRDILKEKRLEYFVSRYELFCLLDGNHTLHLQLGNATTFFMKAQEIYAEDGDLYLLRVLQEIVIRKGDLSKKENLQVCIDYLTQALSLDLGNQALAIFHKAYVQVWQSGANSNFNTQELLKAGQCLPQDWRYYFIFLLFLKAENYLVAFQQCKYLSSRQIHSLEIYMKELKKHLSWKDRRELKKIEAMADGKRKLSLSEFLRVNLHFFFAIVVVVFIVFFGFYRAEVNQNNLPNQAYQLNVESNRKKENGFEDFAAEDATSPERFVYHCLYSDDASKRETFLIHYTAEPARSLIKSKENERRSYKAASPDDFSFKEDTTATDGKCCVVYYHDKPLVILKLNEIDKITDILGGGWTEISDENFEALLDDISITKQRSFYVFRTDYLPSLKRESMLEDHSQYFTDELMILLKEKVREKPVKKYSEDNWKISIVADILYVVFWDNADELGMILQFDDYGRLAHIYLDGWEEMDQEQVNQILSNCEESQELS